MGESETKIDMDFEQAASEAAVGNCKYAADHFANHPDQIAAFREKIISSYPGKGGEYDNSKNTQNNIFRMLNEELKKLGSEIEIELVK